MLHIPEYCSPINLKLEDIKKGLNKLHDYLNKNYTKDTKNTFGDHYKSPNLNVRGINNVDSVLHPDGIDRHTEVYSNKNP